MHLPSSVAEPYFPCRRGDSASPPPPWPRLRPEDTPSRARSHSAPPPPQSFGWPEPRCRPAATERPADCGRWFPLLHVSLERTLSGCLPWSPWSRFWWRSGGRWLPARASVPLPASQGQRLDVSHKLPKRRWQDERIKQDKREMYKKYKNSDWDCVNMYSFRTVLLLSNMPQLDFGRLDTRMQSSGLHRQT